MKLLKFFKRPFSLGDIKIKKKRLSFINLKWSFLLFFIFLMPFFASSQININTIGTGFRIPKNTASIGTEVDVHLICKVVKNTSSVNDYFIPTKTAGEWTSFINAVPSITDLVISDCLFCGAGYYLSGGVCVLTSAGYYSPVDNNTIYQCGSNDKYSSVGAGSYTTVTAGYYTTGGTSTTRTGKTICGVGYYCPGPGDGSIHSCPVETTSVTGSDNINDCTSTAACAAGYYLLSSTCTCVGNGYYSPTDNDSRYTCPAGSYCPGCAGAPSTCSAGTYSSSGYSSCPSCACSTYSSAGSSSCSTGANGYNCSTRSTSSTAYACTSGYNSITSNCSYTCTGGYFDSNRDGNCELVTGAYYSPANNFRRYSCSSGYTALSGSDSSADCTIPTSGCGAGYNLSGSVCICVGNGYYSPTNNNSRYTCPAGSYCSGCAGAPSSCSAGTYSSYGSSSCTTCAAGTYNTSTGSSSCYACPAGKYCTGGTNNTCCPDGRYRASTWGISINSCFSCAAGTYGVGTCQTSNTCATCSAGYYSSTGAASCSACPAGYTCPAGSDSSADCVQNCSASTVSGYSVPALASGTNKVVSKYPCYRSNGGIQVARAYCTDGTISIAAESNLSCFTGYHYTYGGWYQTTYGCYYVCVLEVCSAGSVGGYDYPQLNHAAITTDTRPITGGFCTGTLKCHDGTTTLQSETCSCGASSWLGYTYPSIVYGSSAGVSKTGPCSATISCSATGGISISGDGCSCPPGQTTYTIKTAPPEYFCGSCVAGYYCPGNSVMTACPAGTYSNDGASSCTVLCGNGVCDSSLGETCSSCANDCGGCSCWGDYQCEAGQTCEGPGYCSGYNTSYCYSQPTDEYTCVNNCYGSWYLSSSGVCCGSGCWDTYGGQCYCY